MGGGAQAFGLGGGILQDASGTPFSTLMATFRLAGSFLQSELDMACSFPLQQGDQSFYQVRDNGFQLGGLESGVVEVVLRIEDLWVVVGYRWLCLWRVEELKELRSLRAELGIQVSFGEVSDMLDRFDAKEDEPLGQIV